MSQDTRKDKRAKVVSLNVRYKSATVDEFIENHSHDVSKGGIFVKTPTPFAPGTLLKFEIRLAGDKSVISGVGRVVWKREPPQAAPEKPAGMGVKFIKIDDASRAIIDRLSTEKVDAGSAYTSESPFEEGAQPATLRGLAAATPAEEGAPVPSSPVNVPPPAPGTGPKLPVPAPPRSAKPLPPPPTSAPAESRPAAPRARKATMMGVGLPSVDDAGLKAAASTPPPAAAMPSAGPPRTTSPPTSPPPASSPPAEIAEPMFPSLPPESGHEPAVGEQTVMKQAAELLEEALKEAGGSMDDVGDVGDDALFSKAGEATTDLGRAARASSDVPTSGVSPSLSPSQPLPMPAVAVAPGAAPRRLADDVAGSPKKGGGAGLYLAVLLVVALGVGGVYAWQTGKLAGVLGPGPEPAPLATTPSLMPSPRPTASEVPSASASAPAPLATVEAGAETMDAAAGTMTMDGSSATPPGARVDAGAIAPDAAKAAAPAVTPPGARPRPHPAVPTTPATDTPTKAAPPPPPPTPPPGPASPPESSEPAP